MSGRESSEGRKLAEAVGEFEIHVWRVELEQPAVVVDGLRGLLAEDELARASRFYFEEHRRRFIVARAALRRILGRYLGLDPDRVAFSYEPKGKPAIAGGSDMDLQFNVTHTDDLALYAVTRGRPVGIDVELRREMPEALRIARRFFTADEVDWLRDHRPEERSDAFLTLWTRKEAYVKAIGEGLSCPLNRIDVWESDEGSGHVREPEAGSPEERPWRFWDLSVGSEHMAALAVPEGPALFRSRCWLPAGDTESSTATTGRCGPADDVRPRDDLRDVREGRSR
ncbi:MAG: 4'-phosphopantetheinyl transferase superfamily protein [Acidobacteriota bacterium]|nr:4'-phosphopantetheinyl transferase superfamily protein [Acidobacteriota bacterium]